MTREVYKEYCPKDCVFIRDDCLETPSANECHHLDDREIKPFIMKYVTREFTLEVIVIGENKTQNTWILEDYSRISKNSPFIR